MKKLFSYFLIFLIFTNLFLYKSYASDEETYFIVTAYYSPLPFQKYYLTGNYSDELRLNGQGIRGASGQEVFEGMLAAPKNYDFGTKIYLEGLGIGDVQDRGGAIVNAGERGYNYDRIDVWMGYGDEGLRRALYWGKRKVKGNIVSSSSNTSINIKTIPAPLWATNGLTSIASIFYKGIGKNTSSDNIIELQKFLAEIGTYKGDINGVYNDDLIDIIYNFQLENSIVKSEYDLGAGYRGSKTRSLFLKKYLNGDFSQTEEDESNILKEELDIFSGILGSEEKTKRLQELLLELGLYDGEINGDYEDLRTIVLNFQLDNKVILNNNDIGAGYFGPKTRKKMKEVYEDFLVKKEEEEFIESKLAEHKSLSYEKSEKKIEELGDLALGDISVEVRKLQNIMKELGYFDYKDTAIFGEITKNSIASFQLENFLIDSPNSIYAGILGERTKETLKNKYADYLCSNLVFQDKELYALIEKEGI